MFNFALVILSPCLLWAAASNRTCNSVSSVIPISPQQPLFAQERLAIPLLLCKCIARVGLEYRLWAGSQLIPMAIRRSDRRPLFYAHATGNVAIRRFACMSFRAAAQILYCQKTFEGGNFAIPLTGWLLTSNCLRREVSQ